MCERGVQIAPICMIPRAGGISAEITPHPYTASYGTWTGDFKITRKYKHF